MTRVLVTGAGGFLGAHVIARLAAAGHEVRATARGAASLPEKKNVELVTMDLACGDLRALVAGCDAVVHCAARAVPWGPREIFLRDNALATRLLVGAAVAAGTVRRFVHVSSPSIYFSYGNAVGQGEQFEIPPKWPTHYAESKWLAEQAVLTERRLGAIALRPRAVIGKGDRAIVPRILALARRGYFPLPGGGRAIVDVTCVANVVDAIELALQAPVAAEGRAFNITNGEPMAVRDLLTRLFDVLGLRVRMVAVPVSLARGLAACAETLALLRRNGAEPRVTRYGMGLLAYSQTLSIAAARDALGYVPRMTVTEGLRSYADPGST
jgi:nucleoside-diphosphate-sugar epimerase